MSLPLCPKHKVPLLPEGANLLACPECQHTVVRIKPSDTEARRQNAVLMGGYKGRKKKP